MASLFGTDEKSAINVIKSRFKYCKDLVARCVRMRYITQPEGNMLGDILDDLKLVCDGMGSTVGSGSNIYTVICLAAGRDFLQDLEKIWSAHIDTVGGILQKLKRIEDLGEEGDNKILMCIATATELVRNCIEHAIREFG